MRVFCCLLALIAATSLSVPALAGAPCSDSHAQLVGYNSLFAVPAPVFDTTYASSEAGWDLPAGTVLVSRAVGGVNWTRSIATDDYDITGVTPGTVVNLTAAFDVNGYVTSPGCGGSGCGGYFQASITHGVDSNQQQVTFPDPFAGGTTYMLQTLTLPITITAGTPATLEFELAVFVPSGGNAGGAGTGAIHFTGLPAGAQVISCKGYGSLATPTRGSSWGSLKVHYR